MRDKLKYDLPRMCSINIRFFKYTSLSHRSIAFASISPRAICIARGQMLASHEILSGIRSQNKYNSESPSNQSITSIAYVLRMHLVPPTFSPLSFRSLKRNIKDIIHDVQNFINKFFTVSECKILFNLSFFFLSLFKNQSIRSISISLIRHLIFSKGTIYIN